VIAGEVDRLSDRESGTGGSRELAAGSQRGPREDQREPQVKAADVACQVLVVRTEQVDADHVAIEG
jgi:hypothetical protein